MNFADIGFEGLRKFQSAFRLQNDRGAITKNNCLGHICVVYLLNILRVNFFYSRETRVIYLKTNGIPSDAQRNENSRRLAVPRLPERNLFLERQLSRDPNSVPHFR